MPGVCYLCEEEAIGYLFGGYFCEECEKVKQLVQFLGSRKITESVRFKMEKINETKMRRASDPAPDTDNEKEMECYSATCPSKNTRSKKRSKSESN
jgi:hypothetical protein